MGNRALNFRSIEVALFNDIGRAAAAAIAEIFTALAIAGAVP
jgi:hypothetical protein